VAELDTIYEVSAVETRSKICEATTNIYELCIECFESETAEQYYNP
jgi:hypothetical protein